MGISFVSSSQPRFASRNWLHYTLESIRARDAKQTPTTHSRAVSLLKVNWLHVIYFRLTIPVLAPVVGLRLKRSKLSANRGAKFETSQQKKLCSLTDFSPYTWQKVVVMQRDLCGLRFVDAE
jgi:hypothetical protein